jgi:multiple sugar transport system permease protein
MLLYRKSRRMKMLREKLAPYVYFIPVGILIIMVYIYPFSKLIKLSFYEVGLSGVGRFVGYENYKYIFTPDFLYMVLRTAIWIGLSVPPAIALGLAGALLLNRQYPGVNVLRALSFIPWLVPAVLVAIMWRWTFHPAYGMFNNILISLGIIKKGISLMVKEKAMFYVVLMRIWRATPFACLTILAGLQAIDPSVYEAAKLDGASKFQQLWYISLPMIRPVLEATTIILIIWTSIQFEMVYVLTGGGPGEATEIFAVSVYKEAFQGFRVGIASMMGSVGIVLIGVATIVFQRIIGGRAR